MSKIGHCSRRCFNPSYPTRPLRRISLHVGDYCFEFRENCACKSAIGNARKSVRHKKNLRSGRKVRQRCRTNGIRFCRSEFAEWRGQFGQMRLSVWKMLRFGTNAIFRIQSAERIVLPDSSAALDYLLAKTASLLDGLVVYPENMLKNLNATHGIVFSGQLMLALTQKGCFAGRCVFVGSAKCDDGLGRRRRISGFSQKRCGHFFGFEARKKLPAFLITNIICETWKRFLKEFLQITKS